MFHKSNTFSNMPKTINVGNQPTQCTNQLEPVFKT